MNNAVPLSYSLPFGPVCVLNACQIPSWAFVCCLPSLKEAVIRFLSLLRLFRQEMYLFLCILFLFLKKKNCFLHCIRVGVAGVNFKYDIDFKIRQGMQKKNATFSYICLWKINEKGGINSCFLHLS